MKKSRNKKRSSVGPLVVTEDERSCLLEMADELAVVSGLCRGENQKKVFLWFLRNCLDEKMYEVLASPMLISVETGVSEDEVSEILRDFEDRNLLYVPRG